MDIKNYSDQKLKKNIRIIGWILIIMTVAVIYFGFDYITNKPEGNTTLFALIAVIAGSSSAFFQRKNMIKELKSRV
jgi:hypothetical protein